MLKHLPLIIISLGILGFLGNLYTFLQPDLRSNTFCIYTLSSSVVDVSHLLFNRILKYLNQAYGFQFPWNTNVSLCKFQLFLLVFLPQLSINLLALALVDLYASTCSLTSSMRRLNRPKFAPYFILLTIIYSCFAVFHAPTFSTVVPIQGCAASPPITNSIFYVLFCGLIQPLVMLSFVYLTYRNIVQSRRQVGVVVHQGYQQRPRNQFVGLVFTQVFLTTVLCLQWIAIYSYYVITLINPKTPEQQALILLIYLISQYFLTLKNVKSFYLSTLTSRSFRRTFIKGLGKTLRCATRPQAQPTSIAKP